MDKTYISEAFQACSLLTEEDLDVTQDMDSLDSLDKILHSEDEETIDVIDPEAETKEEAEEVSHIGDVLLTCSVCQTPMYKHPEDVVIDEEAELANVTEECPKCYSTAGFFVEGQIEPFKPESEVEVEVTDKEETEDDDEDDEVEDTEEKEDTEEEKEVEESLCKDGKCKKHDKEKVAEEFENDDEFTVYEDSKTGKKYAFVKDKFYEVGDASEYDNLREGFENVELETEDKIIKVSEEEKPETDDEMITPVDDALQDEIVENSTEDDMSEEDFDDMGEGDEEMSDDLMQLPADGGEEGETVDIDVDEFDEDAFNDLGESYLKKVYSNVSSFEVSNVSNKGNDLMVEGIITFTSGNKKTTNFIFESNVARRSGRVKFLGENKQISRGKKSFVLTGRVDNKKFIAESFRYNYRSHTPEGKPAHVYGTIKVEK